jgi:hypothetical protein
MRSPLALDSVLSELVGMYKDDMVSCSLCSYPSDMGRARKSIALGIGGSLLSLACGQSGSGVSLRPGSMGDMDAGDSGGREAGEDSAAAGSTDGSAAQADGAFSSAPAGTLVLQIGGSDQGVTYDVMRVGGRATLGGQLVLQYTGGYVPPAGQKFVLVEADGGIAGTFATLTSPGVEVQVGQDANSLWVTVK